MNVTVLRRRGPKPSPEKRRALIAAAVGLFAARGTNASTREIAAHAGTTERTLFKHFGSKEGLLRAVIQEAVIEGMREKAFARVWDPTPFTRDEFAAWHRTFLANRIETATAAPDNYRILFRELFRDDRFREVFGPQWLGGVFEPLAEHLGRMQETGAIPRTHGARALASSFFSMTIGYLLSRFVLMPGLGWRDPEDAEAIVALFMTACGASAEGGASES